MASATLKGYKLFVSKVGLIISILHVCCNVRVFIGIKLKNKLDRNLGWWSFALINLAKVILKNFKSSPAQPSANRLDFNAAVGAVKVVSPFNVAQVASFKNNKNVINSSSVIIGHTPNYIKNIGLRIIAKL